MTAAAVASARALASSARGALVDPEDRLAEQLLPRSFSLLVRALREGDAGRGLLSTAATHLSLGMIDHVALRSRVIDALLEREVERGVDQLVILGAGLDTRAHRLTALRTVSVYEVDHPDSQREKRLRTRGLPLSCAAHAYVALDLTQGGLRRGLSQAGHRSEAGSVFVVEGVVPYLTREAVADMLREVALAAAPGSRVIVTYVTPELVWLQRARPLVLASMRLIGEPFLSALYARDMLELLEAAGFELEHDSDTRDWARELCGDQARSPLVAYERLSVGRRS